MRVPTIDALAMSALLTACGSIGRGEAERLLRERIGAGDEVRLNTYVGSYTATEYINDLVRLGIIEFTPGEITKDHVGRATVTAEGARLGAALQEGEILGGKLCEIVFGAVTRLGKPSGDSVAIVEVDYVLRHANDTPLMAKLRGSKAVSPSECSADTTFVQHGQFIRGSDAWRLNRAPVISNQLTTTVQYEYDRFGSRTGAMNEVKILAPTDGDGDSVTVTWSGSEFTGKELAPMTTLKSAGLSATFPGMSGAVVYAIARDRWGGVDSVKFCFESSRFSC